MTIQDQQESNDRKQEIERKKARLAALRHQRMSQTNSASSPFHSTTSNQLEVEDLVTSLIGPVGQPVRRQSGTLGSTAESRTISTITPPERTKRRSLELVIENTVSVEFIPEVEQRV